MTAYHSVWLSKVTRPLRSVNAVQKALVALLAGLLAGSGAQATPSTYHCFYKDTNLGYILEPATGRIKLWGGVVPQDLRTRDVTVSDGPEVMRAVAVTTITSDIPAPDFLPMEVTETFRLTGPEEPKLTVRTTWAKSDGTPFPDYFFPTDFAPEPFVPGTWFLPCAEVAPTNGN